MPKIPFTRDKFDATLVLRALKEPEFRQELLSAPTETYARALGRPIPNEAEIRVVEETPNVFYLVLPYVPHEEELSEKVLGLVARRKLTHREPCWGVGDGLNIKL